VVINSPTSVVGQQQIPPTRCASRTRSVRLQTVSRALDFGSAARAPAFAPPGPQRSRVHVSSANAGNAPVLGTGPGTGTAVPPASPVGHCRKTAGCALTGLGSPVRRCTGTAPRSGAKVEISGDQPHAPRPLRSVPFHLFQEFPALGQQLAHTLSLRQGLSGVEFRRSLAQSSRALGPRGRADAFLGR
jgi:hypothetical protein